MKWTHCRLVSHGFCLAGLMAVWTTCARAQQLGDSLTVVEVVQAARHRAPSVVAADIGRQSAVLESTSVSRIGGPDFSFVARALIAPKGFYDPALTNLGEYETKVVMDWALIDGGVKSRARARATLDLAEARLNAAVQARDTGLDVADLATNLLRLREVETAQHQAVDWLDRLGVLMRGAVRSGVRTTSDSVRIALERNTAVASLEKTRYDMRTAEIDLLTVLTRGADSSIVIREFDFPERPPTPEDSVRVLASAEHQPELALARVAEERAHIDVLEAQHTNVSTLDLSLDAGLGGTNLTQAVPDELLAEDPNATFADRLRRDLGASASINFKAPQRGKQERIMAESKAAAARAAGVKHGGEIFTQRRVALEIIERWRSAYRQLEVARQASAGAEQNLLRMKSLYSGGAIQLLDLLDARRVYEEALERLAEARQECRSAQFRAEDRR